MLNLREPSPQDSSPSSSPSEDTREVEAVESVRRLLESRQPPGTREHPPLRPEAAPAALSFGVGVWLWLVQIAEWFVQFLRWLGRGSGRVVKALRLAGFLGRRMQNLGARVGYWGRNWSTAEGRLGRLGVWCAAFGESAVKQGAALAVFTDGASDLTKRAREFLRDITDDPDPTPDPDRAADGGGPAPDPQPPASRPGDGLDLRAQPRPPGATARVRAALRVATPPASQPRPAAEPLRHGPGSPRRHRSGRPHRPRRPRRRCRTTFPSTCRSNSTRSARRRARFPTTCAG